MKVFKVVESAHHSTLGEFTVYISLQIGSFHVCRIQIHFLVVAGDYYEVTIALNKDLSYLGYKQLLFQTVIYDEITSTLNVTYIFMIKK